MDSVDLQSKYQTLAAEYSKVTAKCTVLKRAVLDEQAKNAELKNELTETDRQLRQQQQEVESLIFRNEQLTRRVSVLQEELDPSPQSKHSKKKGFKSPAVEHHVPSNLNVLEEELMSKINANVKLNEMLSESESRHQEELGTLTSRVHQLEAQLRAVGAPASPGRQTPPAPPDTEDRSAVCADCERRRSELRAVSGQLERTEAERTRLAGQLADAEREAADLRRALAQHTPLLDTGHARLDRLNVPLCHRGEQRRAAQLAAELGGQLAELAAALSNYHSYCEQRLHALSPHGLSAVRAKLSTLLLAHRYALSPVPAALQRLSESAAEQRPVSPQTLPELAQLADAVRGYHVFLDRVVSYERLSLQEETSMEGGGQQYVGRLARMAAVFGRLQSVLAVLGRQASRSEEPCVSTSRRLLTMLSHIVDDLHSSLRDLSKSYTVLMSEERDLASASAALGTTNECILSSLVAATTAAEKMRSAWAASLPWMCRLTTVTFRSGAAETGASADVLRLSARCAAYLRLLDGSGVGSRGSFDPSLAGSLGEGDEAETAARLDQCQKTVTELEQARERWRLEYQLLKAKYERLQAEMPAPAAAEPAAEDSEDSTRLDTPDGELRISGRPWADLEAREARLKADLAQQLDGMVERLQTAEGKCRHYQIECRHLVRSLSAVEETCEVAQRQLAEATAARQSLRQELVTTSASYETQVAAMSDHLAGLNETLAAQRDQMDQLRYQLGQRRRANR